VRAARRDLAQRVPLLLLRRGDQRGGVGHGRDRGGWILLRVGCLVVDSLGVEMVFLLRVEEALKWGILQGDGIEGGNGRGSARGFAKTDRRAPNGRNP
jgi:hypothetical protein